MAKREPTSAPPYDSPELSEFALYLKLDCGLSANTIAAYVSDMAALEAGLARPLSTLTREDVRAHLSTLERSGIGASSRSRKLSAIRMFSKLALQKGWVALDPTTQLESPKTRRPLPKTLSPEEVEALLEAPITAGAAGDAIMLRVLYAAGLRVSELTTLSPEQTDTQSGMLRLQGKGEKIRIVPIDSETASLVERYLHEIRPVLRKKGGPAVKHEALFLSSHGRPFTRQGFWKLVKRYAARAGITANVSPHVLRHAFATHLLERGMNLRSLQMLLGHSDIGTTEIYSHVSKAHLHEALGKHHPRAARGRKPSS